MYVSIFFGLEMSVHILLRMFKDMSEGRYKRFCLTTINVTVIGRKVHIHNLSYYYLVTLYHWSFQASVDRHEHSAIGKTYILRQKPVKGAMASSKPNIPREVTVTAPKLCFSKPKALIEIPSRLATKEVISVIALTKNAGIIFKGPVLFLCSSPPEDFFMLEAFSLR